jgi:hypothetical protein
VKVIVYATANDFRLFIPYYFEELIPGSAQNINLSIQSSPQVTPTHDSSNEETPGGGDFK